MSLKFAKLMFSALFMLAAPAFVSASVEDDLKLVKDDFYVEWDAEINVGPRTRNGTSLSESFIALNAFWGEKVRAHISTKLEHAFNSNMTLNPNFSLQEFIREAYVEIRQVNGSSVALVIGKQPMAFGQNYHEMPIWTNNPLERVQEIEEVIGVTVVLPDGLFGLVDHAEVSVFETQSRDLSIGSIDGVSVRLSRYLTQNWLLTLSHAEMGNTHLRPYGFKKESRSSVGLIGTTSDGTLVGWVEGMLFTNNPSYPGSHVAFTAGASYQLNQSTQVVAEFTYISKVLYEVAIGLKKQINQNISFGPEIRYTNMNGGVDFITLGLNMRARFSTGATGYEPEELDEEDKRVSKPAKNQQDKSQKTQEKKDNAKKKNP